eukprot:6483742-Amphidinium_carterae.1
MSVRRTGICTICSNTMMSTVLPQRWPSEFTYSSGSRPSRTRHARRETPLNITSSLASSN